MQQDSYLAMLQNLTENYRPFQSLPPELQQDISRALRVFELYKNEDLYLRPKGNNDHLFLLTGHVDIELNEGEISLVPFAGNNVKPLLLPDQSGPFKVSAHEYSVLFHIDRKMLDDLISIEEMTDGALQISSETLPIWRNSLVKNCALLRRLPAEHIETVFSRMTIRKVKAGEEVIRQGEKGDAFYIIKEGIAEVWRTGLFDVEQKHTENLSAGDTCGNQALLTGQSHPKTVKMKTDGTLLVLSQKDFDIYFRKELVHTVSADIAKVMIENGYGLLDVRYEEEYEENRIPGAILIPLHELRQRINELDASKRYVIYCHSGNRSLVAAMRLAQHNIESFSLEGGIRDWPYQTEGEYSTSAERRQRTVCRRGIKPNRMIN
jgi:rhodanese-related sulfurtransferase